MNVVHTFIHYKTMYTSIYLLWRVFMLGLELGLDQGCDGRVVVKRVLQAVNRSY